MHSRTSHLTGVLIGLASAFAVGYLLLKSAVQLYFTALMYASAQPPAVPPSGETQPPGLSPITLHGSVSAAGMLLVIAIIVGLLASTRRLSPLAPLLAGLLLLAVALVGQFAYLRTELWVARNLPNFGLVTDSLWNSGIWQLLGGILLASAAMPWRWTGKLAAAGRNRTAIGVLIGLFGIAGLWYLLQLASFAGYAYLIVHDGLPHVVNLVWLPQAVAAAVIGVLAASRWVSPIAAVIAGIPLLLVGLLLVIAPVGAARWTSPFVWGGQPISYEPGQSLSLGVLVLVGGLLVVASAAPWRWRQPSTAPAADVAAVVEAA